MSGAMRGTGGTHPGRRLVNPPKHNCWDYAEERASSKDRSGAFKVTVTCGICELVLDEYVDSVL